MPAMEGWCWARKPQASAKVMKAAKNAGIGSGHVPVAGLQKVGNRRACHQLMPPASLENPSGAVGRHQGRTTLAVDGVEVFRRRSQREFRG